jgi:hypothetical protein
MRGVTRRIVIRLGAAPGQVTRCVQVPAARDPGGTRADNALAAGNDGAAPTAAAALRLGSPDDGRK